MGSLYRRSAKGKFYGEYTNGCGKRVRKSTGTTNKQDAARILAQWETSANDERHGLSVSPKTTLDELLAEYVDYLGNTGDTHRDKTEARIRRVLESTMWIKPPQVNQLELEQLVRKMSNARSGKKLAMRTQAHYLTAWKAFTRWLTHVRRAYVRDPLVNVRKPNYAHDRKLVRRFLLPEEWPWLAQTDHATLYQTAIETGLRAGELRYLCRHHVHDDHILLPAKFTKNKQQAKQYITENLRHQLQSISLPFDVPSPERLAELLRDDLSQARKLYVDTLPKGSEPLEHLLHPSNASGHILDFHALRHTCGAWLAISGVNPKVIQSVMRHSTITLTLDTYGHLLPGAEQDAIKHIARLLAVDLCQDSGTQGHSQGTVARAVESSSTNENVGETAIAKQKEDRPGRT